MRHSHCLAIGLLLLAFAQYDGTQAVQAADADSALPVIIEDDFENGMDRWQTTDPDPSTSVWEVIEAETEPGQTGNHVLRVKGASKYEPPYRSPWSIAWLKDAKVGDFEFTAKVQNTNPSGGDHRDLCVFWGRQSPAEFYYVHLGAKPDPHACQIFIVNNADRKMITRDLSQGTPWTDGWHNIKVTRHGGEVKVYFDDMTTPVMAADDSTFGAGDFGIGTFDDNGNFDDVVLRGEQISN
jgi:hypothetical protein